MLRLKRLNPRCSSLRDSIVASTQPEKLHYPFPFHHLARLTPQRFFNILNIFLPQSKAAVKKERARIMDEIVRGPRVQLAELNRHGGKIAEANKVLIPAITAVKFPDLNVHHSNGKAMKLPIRISDVAVDADKSSIPKASLVCLAFRSNSWEMVNSWSTPFLEAFSKSEHVHLYQVSFIDSWLLSRSPIKRFLLWTMKKPNQHESKDTLQKQIVFSIGDHYYFRKELSIPNIYTGYVFLLDNFGRVRWQGFGLATKDEVSSLLHCTSLLVDQ